MKILCPTLAGDFLDKVAILIVKKEKSKDHSKIASYEKELLELAPLISSEVSKELEPLVVVNRVIYESRELQNDLMETEDCSWGGPEANIIDNHFRIMKEIYLLNKERSRIKSNLNERFK